MAGKKNMEARYTVSVASDYAEWWRYNIFLVVEAFDGEGGRIEYLKTSDTVYEIGDGTEVREAPEGYDPARPVSLASPPCAYVSIYLYVVPNTFPASSLIRESPDFAMTLTVSRGGEEVLSNEYSVNQWGGITLVGLEAGRG